MDLVIFNKAAAFCAYQERSHQEVRERLRKWNIWGADADEMIAELIAGNYLSEERFAKAYSGGKSRMKHWGRLKIKQELQRRGVSRYSIEQGMKEIGEEEYRDGLKKLLEKKAAQLAKSPGNSLQLRTRLVRFALGKGYEMDLVKEVVDEAMRE
ncbi:MAG: RecX family transcriptional regulator [Cytophagaceae bacterium SCN 52-12]|nr:MAG: RecX family transcriptional regulator [Cytophagaceae bacterium SCN 52-12]